uniref:Hint domain-containing protein n=1 Tax=Chromera velia CCMP2878 TaxID=1169474 RepID=A0A0G4GVA7_9ALVE|mmetsp:Transcript_28241/g.55295  ORF Transcript_28241/g.55295 Transcript_28241/m.55295 type:complete len:928 (+) Transcript_28241:182-2965(+)|eukprot:Cvel_23483.t1-p1 / transcript=Cvel_23483.t1 / gene=Cvel_23483 / organism=Chromera_velia_CCMP2878 / gene_product=hypothetical protein / transcript_product=hypothetical protein / location=Cvel_scaffold2425:7971-13937(-) / protein_length=927 / sequence_SO=supercontig / SO=protein_coding / is_pseudo=false
MRPNRPAVPSKKPNYARADATRKVTERQTKQVPGREWLKGTKYENEWSKLKNPEDAARFMMELLVERSERKESGQSASGLKLADLPQPFLDRASSWVVSESLTFKPTVPLTDACTVYMTRWIQGNVGATMREMLDAKEFSMETLVKDYISFIALRGDGKYDEKPPLPVWALWHSHMLRPLSYKDLSAQIAFKRIDHWVAKEMPNAEESSKGGIENAYGCMRNAISKKGVNVTQATMEKIQREIRELIPKEAFVKDLGFFDDLSQLLLEIGASDIEMDCRQGGMWVVDAEERACQVPLTADTKERRPGSQSSSSSSSSSSSPPSSSPPFSWLLRACEASYRYFLVLAGSLKGEVTPSLTGDLMWHLHMLHPCAYIDDTKKWFGDALVHIPFEPSAKASAAERARQGATAKRSKLAWQHLVGNQPREIVGTAWREEKKAREKEWQEKLDAGKLHVRKLPPAESIQAWIEAVSDPHIEMMSFIFVCRWAKKLASSEEKGVGSGEKGKEGQEERRVARLKALGALPIGVFQTVYAFIKPPAKKCTQCDRLTSCIPRCLGGTLKQAAHLRQCSTNTSIHASGAPHMRPCTFCRTKTRNIHALTRVKFLSNIETLPFCGACPCKECGQVIRVENANPRNTVAEGKVHPRAVQHPLAIVCGCTGRCQCGSKTPYRRYKREFANAPVFWCGLCGCDECTHMPGACMCRRRKSSSDDRCCSCFVAESQVALPGGGTRAVCDLSAGDLVVTGQKLMGGPISGAFGDETVARVARLWECPTDDGSARVVTLRGGCQLTEGHPVWEEDEAGKLRGGKGKWVKVENSSRCEFIETRETDVVYTLELEGHADTVVVDGTVVACLGVYCGKEFGWNVFTRKSTRCPPEVTSSSSSVSSAPGSQERARESEGSCRICDIVWEPAVDFSRVTEKDLEISYPPVQ